MYKEEDYRENKKQLKRRLLVFTLVFLAGLAGAILSFIVRKREITIAITIVFGGVLLFLYSLYVYPIKAYGRHLSYVLHGKKRNTSGYIAAFDEEEVVREGVTYHPLIINVGEKKAEEDERLFYYDKEKMPFPFQLGDYVEITAQEKQVAEMVRATKE